MTFDDLQFNDRDGFGKQATVSFPNGYGASVIGGERGLYGDGVTSFELAVLHHDALCYSTPITNDVLGWQTREQITELLQRIEALPPMVETQKQITDDKTIDVSFEDAK
jgi:hypothetical protein